MPYFDTLRGALGGALQQKLADRTRSGRMALENQALSMALQQRQAKMAEAMFPLQIEMLKKQIGSIVDPGKQQQWALDLAEKQSQLKMAQDAALASLQQQNDVAKLGIQKDTDLAKIAAQREADIAVRKTPTTNYSVSVDSTPQMPFPLTKEGQDIKFKYINLAQDLSETFNTVRENMGNIEVAVNRMMGQDAKSRVATIQASIMSFNKILDALSVVRESEYARTEENLALVDRATGWLDRLTRGGPAMTDENVIELRDTAREMEALRMDILNKKLDTTVRKPVTDLGFNPDEIAPVYVSMQDEIKAINEAKGKTTPQSDVTPQGVTPRYMPSDDEIQNFLNMIMPNTGINVGGGGGDF